MLKRRFSRGTSCSAVALSETKSLAPCESSSLCAMHAAEVRKNRSANRSCSVDERLVSVCATYWSTLIVSAPALAVGAAAPPSPSPSPSPPPSSSSSPSGALRLRLAGARTLSTSASVAPFAQSTTSRAASTSAAPPPLRASMAARSTNMSTELRLTSAIASSWSSPSSSPFSPTACRRYIAMPQHSSVLAALAETSASFVMASRSLHSVRPIDRCASSGSRPASVLLRSRSTSSSTERVRPAAPSSEELSDITLARGAATRIRGPRRGALALALPMHAVAISAITLLFCALLFRGFRHCARRQRDAFLDRERAPLQLVRARFAYQSLPTTVAL